MNYRFLPLRSVICSQKLRTCINSESSNFSHCVIIMKIQINGKSLLLTNAPRAKIKMQRIGTSFRCKSLWMRTGVRVTAKIDSCIVSGG